LAFAGEISYKLDTASFEEKRQIFHALNVSALLEKIEGRKVFPVQCAIEPQPVEFIINNTSTCANFLNPLEDEGEKSDQQGGDLQDQQADYDSQHHPGQHV